MNKERINKIIDGLKKDQIDALLITDPMSIYYLIDEFIHPGERFLGLIIKDNGDLLLVLNRLFHLTKEINIEKLWYFDTDNSMKLILDYLGYPIKTLAVDKMMPAKFLLELMNNRKETRVINGSYLVDYLRMIKDDTEIEIMKKASLINDKAMDVVISMIKEGAIEEDIAEKLPNLYKTLGASGNSFEPIIAFGKNGADGHHSTDKTMIKSGDSVVIDMGCVYEGYCSDMTRTVFFKEISSKQREVYELVKKANESAISMIRPGVLLSEIDKCARDIISEAGYGVYFNHRLGHFIGKEVHEYGDVSSQFDLEVKEGMIFSIEPGVYLDGEFGVRVEDLVLVTNDGCHVLNHYTKDFIIVE